jgi:hypothetical protein
MSAEIDDGGPAFPFGQISEITGQPINGYFAPGMTLRDWFAGQALAAMLSYNGGSAFWDRDAKNAYSAADAMISERKGGADANR